MKNKNTAQKGYTVIETMIAVSIFSIIAVTGITSLLRANLLHYKSQDMRSLIDNMSFIMDEVSRNLRTGYNYRCINDGNYSSGLETPRSCSFGAGIAFEHGDFGSVGNTADQWLYKIESTDGGVTYNISKSTDGGSNWVQLNPPELTLTTTSGFLVLGAEPPPGNTQQPLVTIKLAGSITYQGVVSSFALESAVSQRYVDLQ